MVCLNKNHRHNMAFRAYFIILLLFLLVPYFMDCRAIIDEEIPQISKGYCRWFSFKIYTNLMYLTKRRKLIGERIDPVIPGPYDPSTYGPRTVPNLADPPGPYRDELPPDPNLTKPHRCLKCYYMPQRVPCHCHK
ncbi:hypothetical protein M5K25_025904 [Dendrobium thyrsiflorum]|uniref:Uncharacterized protein n=1 Tax=Dendrobium thyrsiflorum TaxID=117978 RepID=A0ABD0TW66_DENTH